jgi:hypothetical protein
LVEALARGTPLLVSAEALLTLLLPSVYFHAAAHQDTTTK